MFRKAMIVVLTLATATTGSLWVVSEDWFAGYVTTSHYAGVRCANLQFGTLFQLGEAGWFANPRHRYRNDWPPIVFCTGFSRVFPKWSTGTAGVEIRVPL